MRAQIGNSGAIYFGNGNLAVTDSSFIDPSFQGSIHVNGVDCCSLSISGTVFTGHGTDIALFWNNHDPPTYSYAEVNAIQPIGSADGR